MASESLDMAEELQLQRALEESRRSYEEEEARRRLANAKISSAPNSLPPQPSSGNVVLRRPRPQGYVPASSQLVQLPPPSGSSRRLLLCNLNSFISWTCFKFINLNQSLLAGEMEEI